MKKILMILFLSVAFISCEKEDNLKHCWQISDQAGNEIQVECDKTESEIIELCNQHCSPGTSQCWTYKVQ